MNNAVYGKTMENVRNRIEVRMINNNKKKLSELDVKIKLHSAKVFDNNFVAIQKIKTTLILNKPVYVRMCILELSKVPMY